MNSRNSEVKSKEVFIEMIAPERQEESQMGHQGSHFTGKFYKAIPTWG